MKFEIHFLRKCNKFILEKSVEVHNVVNADLMLHLLLVVQVLDQDHFHENFRTLK